MHDAPPSLFCKVVHARGAPVRLFGCTPPRQASRSERTSPPECPCRARSNDVRHAVGAIRSPSAFFLGGGGALCYNGRATSREPSSKAAPPPRPAPFPALTPPGTQLEEAGRSITHDCKIIAAAYRLHLRLAPARPVARVTRVDLGQLRQTRPQHVHKVLRALAEAEAAAEPRLTHLSLAFVEFCANSWQTVPLDISDGCTLRLPRLEVLDLLGCRMASGRVLPAILESCKGTLRRLYLAYLKTESSLGALLCSGRPLVTSVLGPIAWKLRLPALDALDVSGCDAKEGAPAAFLDATRASRSSPRATPRNGRTWRRSPRPAARHAQASSSPTDSKIVI
eukprot:tig00000147_g9481.t1